MSAMHYRPGVEAAPGYKLIELLGRGGFGEVWKAEGPGGVVLAVKVIDKVDDKAGRKEFRALKLIRNLRHPNLVSISGFWLRDADGKLLDPDKLTDDPDGSSIKPSELIVAMELGEASLLERLDECRKGMSPDQKGGIPFDELIEYMEAAARAIDYLNIRHDIQHRDIKPQNILIVGGSAQVCDFGLASAVSSVRTSMGGAGSLAYMAPEIYSTKRPSRATDQYGLAIAYVELRTGRLPLSDIESYAILDEAKRQGKLDLSWLDESEREVIARATALNPEERFARCVDMVQAMRSAVSPVSASVVRTAEPVRPIGDYQPDRQVYRRSGEEVWEAISPERHRVTLVVRDLAESPDLIRPEALPLVREASRRHPHLAELYEFVRLSETGKVVPARLFDGPNPPGFARMLLAGQLCSGNMNDRMTSGGLSAAQLLDDVEQLADAIDFLNEPRYERAGKKYRILHLNVRPANFQLDADGAVLGNFSSAQLLEGDELAFPAGRAVVDSAYNPPEFFSEKITRWSDQYQLAVAYLQMRTGKPSSGLTGSHGGERHSSGAARLDLSELQPAEREVIARATDRVADSRYDSCMELLRALREAAAKDGVTVTLSPDSTTSKTSTRDSDNRTKPDRSETTEREGGVAVKPALSATMAPPKMAETVMHRHTDTDPELLVAPPVAPAAAPIAPQSPARPALAAAPSGQAVRPQRPVAAPSHALRNGLIAAAVLGVAIIGYKGFFGGSKLDSSVKNQIQDGKFLEAIADIEKNQEELSESELEELRQQVRLAWFDEHVAPLDSKKEYNQALDKLAAADKKLATEAQFAHWKKQVHDRWRDHAATLADKGNHGSAAGEYLAIIKRMGPDEKVIVLRGNALDSLLETAKKQLAQKPAEAYIAASHALDAVNSARDVSSLPQEQERNRFRRALMIRMRAAARLSQWDKVKGDLTSAANQLATREEVALGKLFGLLANPKAASPGERLTTAQQLQKSSTGDLDVWEGEQLTSLVKALEAEVKGKRYQELQTKIADAEKKLNDGATEAVLADIAAIRNDAGLRANLVGADARRLDEIQAEATLRKPNPNDAEVSAATAQIEQIAAEGATSEPRLLKLCEALGEEALDRQGKAPAPRTRPALLPRAMQVAGRAKSQMKPGSPAERQIDGLIAKLVAEFRGDLRTLRDEAGKPTRPAEAKESWKRLAAAAKQAADLGSSDRLVAATMIESALENGDRVDLADVSKKLGSVVSPNDPDERYVQFVIGRALVAAGKPAAAADGMLAAWKGQVTGLRTPAAANEEPWQASGERRKAAIAALIAAAELTKTGPDHDPLLSETPGKNDRFTAAAAANAYQLLVLANALSRGVLSASSAADKPVLATLQENLALASAYRPETEADGVSLTDALLGEATTEAYSTQLHVANLRLHAARYKKSKSNESRDRIISTSARLFNVCEAKYLDVKGVTLFDRVIAPAYALAAEAGDKLPDRVKPDAARLAAARGRAIRTVPVIEERFAADPGPEQVAYESYDQAAKWDPNGFDYYIGRGASFYDMISPTAERKAIVLRENAELAQKNAKDAEQQNIARGLLALAFYQESQWQPDYAVKRERLSKALEGLDGVAKAASKTSRKYADVYYALRVTEGGIYLHLANYSAAEEEKDEYLTKAKAVAQSIMDQGASRTHPEWVLLLMGNTEEDQAWFLGKLDQYESSINRFTAAYRASKDDDDPKGQSTALMARGRCRYRQAMSAVPKNDIERRQRLSVALDDLTASIEVAAKWPSLQAESYRWMGEIYQQKLTADIAKATANLEKACQLAKPTSPSWPFYETLRANNALHFARDLIDPENLRRPDPQAAQLLDDARTIASGLLEETDPRIHPRHRVSAAQAIIRSHLWEGAPDRAASSLSSSLAKLSAEDAFNLASTTATEVFKPRGEDRKKRIESGEQDLARLALSEAHTRVTSLDESRLRDLFRINKRYYDYWDKPFKTALDEVKKSGGSKREMLDLLHYVRFHLALAVKLQDDPDFAKTGLERDQKAKAALTSYTRALLDEATGETDWNQPGRDKAKYRADAGL